jgi:hypothetical protein
MAIARERGRDQLGMLDLLGLMLAAGGPQEIPARIAWPLHQALQGLDAEVRRDGLLSELPVVLDFRPSPEVGLAAFGANSAIFALLRDGVLRPQGTGRGASLHVNADALASYRRRLMRLEPRLAHVVHRAATRWAALVATSAKNRSTAARSSGRRRASSNPNRLHVLPGRASVASSAR